MGRTTPSFRIATTIEKRKWKSFRESLDKVDRKLFGKILELDNNNILGLLGKAYSLILLDRKPEAKSLIDKVHSIDPNNELALELKKLFN